MIHSAWYENENLWSLFRRFGYDEVRIQQGQTEAEALISLVQPPRGGRILDLCCGIGRHSIPLARHGFHVTGVDRSQAFIDEARTMAGDLDVEWVVEDMRQFRRPAEFDLAINMFTAFGYFEDACENELVLRHVCESLKPGGAFVIEIKGKEALASGFRQRDWNKNNGFAIIEERSIERDWTWCQNRWIILKDGHVEECTFGHWLYSAAELKALCIAAGFATVHAFGGFDGRPYDHLAQRLTIVARK